MKNYCIVIQGNELALLVESKYINATFYTDAIILNKNTKEYYEGVQVDSPKEIKEKGTLNAPVSHGTTLDEILFSNVRVWNEDLFIGKIK